MRGDGEVSATGPSIRLLLALSRFEAVPTELYIERKDGRYEVVGQTADFTGQQAVAAIRESLPLVEEDAITIESLMQATGIGRPATLRAIDALIAAGKINRKGAGRRGSPHRFWADNP